MNCAPILEQIEECAAAVKEAAGEPYTPEREAEMIQASGCLGGLVLAYEMVSGAEVPPDYRVVDKTTIERAKANGYARFVELLGLRGR